MGLFERIAALRDTVRSVRNTSRTPDVQTEIQRPVQRPKIYGSHGRLEIAELGISIPLYDATDSSGTQRIVDRQDSAAYIHWIKQDAIADHANQSNMANLNMAKAGRTIAVIDLGGEQLAYRCVSSQVGHIRLSPDGKNRIFDANWNRANLQNEGGLCIYTCMHKSAEDIMDVRLTYWRPIIEEAGEEAHKWEYREGRPRPLR